MTIESARAVLESYAEIQDAIYSCCCQSQDRVESLPASASFSHIRVSSGTISDPTARAALQRVELEARIQKLIQQKVTIERAVENIRDIKLRTVLMLRYFSDNTTHAEAAEHMGVTNSYFQKLLVDALREYAVQYERLTTADVVSRQPSQ